MKEIEIRAALRNPIITDPPWMRGLGWRNTLILNEWEIDVVMERLKKLGIILEEE